MNAAVSYDVVVAGAGPAGIAAALESARSGAMTAIVERYGCVGGNLTQGYVGPLLGGVCPGTIGEEIENRICPVYGSCPDFELAKNALIEMLAEAGVMVYLQTQVTGAEMDGERIRRIRTEGKFGTIYLQGKTYIDATGDGDLAVMAGCPWEMGREKDSLIQPTTLMFVIQGVDPGQPLLCQHEEHYTELGDGREYLDLCHKACASGELPENVNIVRLYKTAYPGERMVNAAQENYVDPFDPASVFHAEVALRKQIDQIMAFLKNNIPGFAGIRIKGGASTLGVRESRRILSDHILTEFELAAGQKFPDAVVHNASFCLDIHNPDGPGQSVKEEGCPDRDRPYDIPYTAMTPLHCTNLLTAGRCISGTHVAMSSYRVMRICMAMGQAAGAAAYLLHAENIADTRALDPQKIRRHLINRGVALET